MNLKPLSTKMHSQAINDLGAPPILAARRARIFSEPGFHVWCGSVVSFAGAWWLFYSRWPVSAGYDAWVTHSEIALARGDTAAGPFHPTGRVILPGSHGSKWERDVAHNPTALVHEGMIYLGYMANHGPVSREEISLPVVKDELWWAFRNHQRIGVIKAAHPEGKWTSCPVPTLDVDPAGWDNLLVNNPTIFQNNRGGWSMIYKGVTADGSHFGKEVLHGVADAPSPEGPYTRVPHASPFAAAGECFPAEDPFAWYDRRSETYFALVKDMKGALTKTGRRSIALFQSKCSRVWTLFPGAAMSAAQLVWEDGVMEQFSRIERPQLTFDAEGVAVALQVACLPDGPGAVSYSLSIPLGPAERTAGSSDFPFTLLAP
jgi:hypothetical protein